MSATMPRYLIAILVLLIALALARYGWALTHVAAMHYHGRGLFMHLHGVLADALMHYHG